MEEGVSLWCSGWSSALGRHCEPDLGSVDFPSTPAPSPDETLSSRIFLPFPHCLSFSFYLCSLLQFQWVASSALRLWFWCLPPAGTSLFLRGDESQWILFHSHLQWDSTGALKWLQFPQPQPATSLNFLDFSHFPCGHLVDSWRESLQAVITPRLQREEASHILVSPHSAFINLLKMRTLFTRCSLLLSGVCPS